jgi:hypothetical protein
MLIQCHTSHSDVKAPYQHGTDEYMALFANKTVLVKDECYYIYIYLFMYY